MKRIKEVAHITGLPEKTIRYYESLELVVPARNPENDYREFSQQHVDDLYFLHQAREMDFSLDECRQLLEFKRDPGCASYNVKELVLEHIKQIEERIKNLRRLKNHLGELADQCRGDEGPDCAILEGLQQSACEHTSKK